MGFSGLSHQLSVVLPEHENGKQNLHDPPTKTQQVQKKDLPIF